MVHRYSYEPRNQAKVAKARASRLRTSFKNMRETTKTLKGMKLKKAFQYLQDVLDHKRCVPFRRFCEKIGRTAQAKEFGLTQGRWPEKTVKAVRDLLKNAEANAELKGLDVGKLQIAHIQANRAQPHRRRTYRAHGRINSYNSDPTHVEVVLVQQEAPVPAPPKRPNVAQRAAQAAKAKAAKA